MNPFVFVVGCPRSGTTLTRRLLGAHPEIAMTAVESHWIPECVRRRRGVTVGGLVTRLLTEVVRANPRYDPLGLDQETFERHVALSEGSPYSELVVRLFDEVARRDGKPLAGDKTPAYVLEIELMHELWPWARFVHVIRDGRDVCVSALHWRRKSASFARRLPTWTEDAVTTAALWWRMHVANGRRQGAALGRSLYYELGYERLVRAPETAARELCKFLDVEFDERMLRFHEGHTSGDAGRSAKHAWLPVTPGLRDWRTELTPAEVRRFEAAAGDLLEELAYELSTALSEQEREAAATFKARFVAGLPRRERMLATSE